MPTKEKKEKEKKIEERQNLTNYAKTKKVQLILKVLVFLYSAKYFLSVLRRGIKGGGVCVKNYLNLLIIFFSLSVINKFLW